MKFTNVSFGHLCLLAFCSLPSIHGSSSDSALYQVGGSSDRVRGLAGYNHTLVCGNPAGGKYCEVDGVKFPVTEALSDDSVHKIRCCNDGSLSWKDAKSNVAKGCPFGIYGGSKIPGEGCVSGTYEEAIDYCEGGGARLCTADEVRQSCTVSTGCGYDAHYVWTSTEFIPPPPIEQFEGEHWVACGNPNNGRNCKYDGNFHPSVGAHDMDEYAIRCCSDGPLDWIDAVSTCSVSGGSYIPNYGDSGPGTCRVGTYGDAKAYCERAGARLCYQEEVLDECTVGSGCSYDNEFVWTQTEYIPPPPLVQTNETYWVACGNPNSGKNCEVDGVFFSSIASYGMQLHEIRCCSDFPLDWKNAVENSDRGCPAGVFGGSNIPNYGDSGPGTCRVGTFAEAEDYCHGAGARLCSQEEILERCTESSGCSYDNEYVWTMTPWFPPPPLVQTNETYWVACGNPNGGKNCEVDGFFHPATSSPGLDEHEIRCCSDSPLDWKDAVENYDRGCPAGVFGGSYIPNYGDSGPGTCRVGTFAEAEAYCFGGGARLCSQEEILNSCTESSGCSYDNEFVWTNSFYVPPPPPIETDEDFWVVCGNPTGGQNCKDLNGDALPAISAGGMEVHEIRCCSDFPLDWKDAVENGVENPSYGCPEGVWGGSYIPNFGNSGGGQCRTGTYGEAEAFCFNAGARLCTFEEATSRCTQHSGCSYDNDYIWTSSHFIETNIVEYPGVEHWLVCGNPNSRSAGCKDENGDFHVTYQADGMEGHEVRCCSDFPLDWQGAVNNEDVCPGVWSASYIPFYQDVSFGKCVHNATYGEAKYYCELNGARLCTQIEVANGCTKGSGCRHDDDWVWTSTEVPPDCAIPPSDGFHKVACGSPNAVSSPGCQEDGIFYPTFRSEDGALHEVRCCSEFELPFFERSKAPRKNEGCSVWSISELPAIPGSNGPLQCYHAATHWEAEMICSLNGARLCTELEVVRGCARGSGCQHDRDWVWTATPACSSEQECSALAHEDEYIGCFKQQTLSFKVGKPLSIDMCHESCFTAGYAYYGLRNGDTCFCGDNLGNQESSGEEQCSKSCTLGPGKCGSASCSSVFETGLPPTETYNYEAEYEGCFRDKDHVLTTTIGSGYSIVDCVDACSDADYALASISEGSLCQCGNERLNVKTLCLHDCEHGKGLCGGAGIEGNSIYRNKNGKVPLQSLLECRGGRASWWGDPHFITFDGLAYNCQGFGHFIVAQCDDFMIQGLFKDRGVQGSSATVTDGIAAKYKDYPVVQVNFAMFESELTEYIEGKPIHIFVGNELVNQTETMHDEIDINVNGIYIEIQFPDGGPAIRIKVRTPRTGVMDVDICIPEECLGSTMGILGTPNGNLNDEWTSRTGEVQWPRPNNYKGQGGYEYCVANWCVETEESSLFTYGGDKTFEDFYGCLNDFPGEIVIDDLPPEIAGLCAGLPNEADCLEELAIAEPDEDETIDDILDNNNDIPDIDDGPPDEDPDEDTPPDCAEDIKLSGQVGSAFEKWPIQIVSRNETAVTLKVKSPVLTPNTIQAMHLSYMTGWAHALTCERHDDIDGFWSTEITLQCLYSSSLAYLQIHATDAVTYGAEEGNVATIPECCHADESLDGVPGIAYTFFVACEPQCEEELA